MSEPVGCRFCGCEYWVPVTAEQGEQIACEDCGIAGPFGDTEAEAIKQWNKLWSHYHDGPDPLGEALNSCDGTYRP